MYNHKIFKNILGENQEVAQLDNKISVLRNITSSQSTCTDIISHAHNSRSES